ncbi:MAG: hypothetical protein LIO69_02020 [Oscillospiraceae bacterium]|nr:hypothetical protein [Oscillospiraceae bacterium]
MVDEKYFIGCSTSRGYSCAVKDMLADTSNTAYILKGVPGSGKSTLMKKISDSFPEKPKQIFYCSENPDRIDALYFRDIHLLIVDGTYPHDIDPTYPKGVQSIIDLGSYINASALQEKKDEIIALTDKSISLYRRCRLCLAAVAPVAEDIRTTAYSILDKEKLTAFSIRTAKRFIPKGTQRSLPMGKTEYRCISAMTPKGYQSFIPSSCKIVLIDDDSMTASDIFIGTAAGIFVNKGYDVICGECLLAYSPILEHMIVPELSLVFVTTGFLNDACVEEAVKSINLRRFYDNTVYDVSPQLKKRMRFGKKATAELIDESASMLRAAMHTQKKLESIYTENADFDGLNRLAYKLISEIRGMPQAEINGI